MKKSRQKLPAKWFFIFLLIIALILFFAYISNLLVSCSYFKVRDVLSNDTLNPEISEPLLGKSLFAIDLKRESYRAKKFCSDCLRVRLSRVFPDRIFVEFVRRRPLAKVRLYRTFYVDREGVFFNSGTHEEGSPDVPLITGLETRLFGVSVGKRYENKELLAALEIIKEIGRSRISGHYQLNRLDVQSANDITLYLLINNLLASGYSRWQPPEKQRFIEVRISEGNIAAKVAVMAGLIIQERNNIENVKYIDLRFKEPVIKFKDVK